MESHGSQSPGAPWLGRGRAGDTTREAFGAAAPSGDEDQGGLQVPFRHRAVLLRQGLAQHLVPVEHRLPLLLHLPLPALLRPLHPLQHRVGPGARQAGHCGQGVSVLQGKERGWTPGSAQPAQGEAADLGRDCTSKSSARFGLFW